MAFIIDEQGNYIPVLGATGGGGGTYNLPTASTTVLGGVKIDGTSITIDDGVISSTGGSYSDFTGADGENAGTNGLVPAPTATDNVKFLKGDGSWGTPTNTTYSNFTGADGDNAGAAGLVPAPSATDNTAFLKGDGTWVTPDDSLSSTSTNPVQNNIIYPSLSNFIPKGTTINIKTDGTGDFTKLSDAITYIEGKWSNGTVTLQLGTGTFTESNTVTVNTVRFNIPHLQIKGTSKTDTIIKGKLYFSNGSSFIQLNDFGIEGTDSSTGAGIEYNFLTNTRINNIAVSKFARGVYLDWGGKAYAQNITATDVNLGVSANRGGEITLAGTYTATNVTTAVEIAWGSIIKLSGASKAFTNVTTQTSQNANTMSTAGVILGGWSN